MSAATSSSQLLDGILKGQVPRQIRLFAAQGLLPITREELLHLQVVLPADQIPSSPRSRDQLREVDAAAIA
jgi:hypothetical protein